MRSEEQQLETKLDTYRRELATVSKNVGDTQLEISQVKTKLVEFEEYERQLGDGTNDLEVAITTSDAMKLNSLIARTITPPEVETLQANKGFDDEFKQKDSSDTGFSSDPFAGEDPFKEGKNFGNISFI